MNRTETARQTLTLHTVAHLRDLAREAGIAGRSAMRKAELVEALIPTQVAEIRQAEANRASLAKQTERRAPLASSAVGKAMEARDAYWQVRDHCGQENGGPAVSIAWEDYLDACDAAGVCTQTKCWDRATDGDGRCGRHSHGAPLGEDVVPTPERAEPVSRETDRVESDPALEDLPLSVLRRLNTRCQTPPRFGLTRPELEAHLLAHTTKDQRYEAARLIASSVTRSEAEAIALADVRRGYDEAEVPDTQVVAHVQANCEVWRIESDDAGDPISQFAFLVLLGARVPADENPEVRCAQCGATHGKRGFLIGRTRHGDYEYDAAWGANLQALTIPKGWGLAIPNATEPNVIECDCWPNGVRSSLDHA